MYTVNLGIGSKRKEGCGGVEHESRTWFNEERREGKWYRLAIQPLCWSKREKGGNPVHTSVRNRNVC